MRDRIVVLISLLLLAGVTWGQQQSSGSSAPSTSQQSMPGMDMSGHDMSNMQMKDMPMATDKDKDADKDGDASAHAMHSMEGHMDMGPHMKMTALRLPRPGDAARAEQVVETARKASEKYLDYNVALADGYKIFHPEIPQKMYHFTNYGYAMEAAFRFTPEHPTSLLYEKHGDDYKLIGVMYTAPKRLGEDQLDERVPLSVAQWHEHVNFCAPRSRATLRELSRLWKARARLRRNTWTIAPLWPRATRFSILRFRRRCITSLTTDTRWKRLFVSLPSIPPRCSMKNMAKTTN